MATEIRVPTLGESVTEATVAKWFKKPGEAVKQDEPLVELETDKVTENASFIDDLGADSLDTVELVMAFEEEFSIEVPDEEAEKLQSVGDVVRYVEEHGQN